MEWLGIGEQHRQKVRREHNAEKVMLSVWFDSEGIIYW